MASDNYRAQEQHDLVRRHLFLCELKILDPLKRLERHMVMLAHSQILKIKLVKALGQVAKDLSSRPLSFRQDLNLCLSTPWVGYCPKCSPAVLFKLAQLAARRTRYVRQEKANQRTCGSKLDTILEEKEP